MTETKKRLHSEVNAEIDGASKAKKRWWDALTVNKDAVHRLKVGTIIVMQPWCGGHWFYVVDSFTKGGAPRCSELKREHIVTARAMSEEHTVDKLVRERIEGTKPTVFRLTKNGLCSRNTSFAFYDEEIEYTHSRYWD